MGNFFSTYEKRIPLIAYILGIILVAYGQPVYSSILGLISGNIGFALLWWAFWKKDYNSVRWFWWGTLAFALVQAVQLLWMTSYDYQGYYIFFVWFAFCCILGIQFGFLCWVFHKVQDSYAIVLCVIPSVWTLLEWSRLYWLSGFTWNPVGMAFLGNLYARQGLALAGIYGISFLVIFLNCIWYHLFQKWCFWRAYVATMILGTVMLFGYWRVELYYDRVQKDHSPPKQAVLFTTKEPPLAAFEFESIWHYAEYALGKLRRTLPLLKDQVREHVDLIVFPESYFPFPADFTVYPLEEVEDLFSELLGIGLEQLRPELVEPYARLYRVHGESKWMVSNGFCLQFLANYFDTDVLIGLEQMEKGNEEDIYYNAVIHFSPHDKKPDWYAKRRLIPIAEYFPFSWVRPIARIYGIEDAFFPGNTPKIFKGKTSFIAPSVCYEETYSSVIRENALLGADCLVNVTNDIWFPRSDLAHYHFYLGAARAVETGLPAFRACNMGVSAIVNPLGEPIATLGESSYRPTGSVEILSGSLSPLTLPTLYMQIGDRGIVALALFLMGLGVTLFVFLKDED